LHQVQPQRGGLEGFPRIYFEVDGPEIELPDLDGGFSPANPFAAWRSSTT